MKHIAQVQSEFLQAMKEMHLDKDDTVKVEGIPFKLKDDTTVLGHPNNVNIAKRPSLDCLGDQQRFFQDDNYGPDNRTVFYSNKNDNNEFGVFLVHSDNNNLNFMRVRSPGWILVNNVKSGRYIEVPRQGVSK